MSGREYVSHGLTPQRLASIFRDADAGDVRRQIELFTQIEERDGHLAGEKSKRCNAVRDVNFLLEPASDDKRDIKIYDFVQAFFDSMTEWSDTLVSMQDAIGKGFAALEIKWDVSTKQAMPTGFDFIDQRRFIFYGRDGMLRRYPLLITDDDPAGIDIPAWSMMMHIYNGMTGHPTRSGLFRVSAWMDMFKNYSVKDWLALIEVYGMPVRLGKYDISASPDDISALKTAVRRIGVDASGVISKNTEIEFVETVSGALGSGIYGDLIRFCDREVSKAWLGHAQAADSGTPGSYASDNLKNEVRLDLVKSDTFAIAATARNQLFRPLVGFNFGWDSKLPLYYPDWEESEDLVAKANWMTALMDRGVKMPLTYVRREFSIPDTEDGEEEVGGLPTTPMPSAVPATPVAAKQLLPGDNRSQDSAEAVAKKALEGAPEDYWKPIDDLIQTAESLEEVKDKILSLKLPMDQTGEYMARAMALANLIGRYDANSN